MSSATAESVSNVRANAVQESLLAELPEMAYVHSEEFASLTLAEVLELDADQQLYRTDDNASSGAAYEESEFCLQSRPLLSAAGESFLFRKMNYLKFLANQALLAEQADEPAEDWQQLLDDAEFVRNQIAECNLRLVVSIARRFANSPTELDELISEANLILIKAIDKFDYSRGFRFSTYATHSVQRHIYRWSQRKQRQRSFGAQIAPEAFDAIPAAEIEEPQFDERFAASVVAQVGQCLDDREQYIIRERFGLGASGLARTLRDLAGDLGVSKERVRQIQIAALDKLRQLFPPEVDLAGVLK